MQMAITAYNYVKYLDIYFNCCSFSGIIPLNRLNSMTTKNRLKIIREKRLMSKAELARLAGVSPVTIDRIEKGEDCRVETKRKLILALGFSLDEKEKVFQD